MYKQRFFHALASANPTLTKDSSHLARLAETVHHTHMLDLRTWNITCIPPEIAILDDLTVLRIGGTGMTNLPPELGTLHALEALEITSATNLAAVPDIFDGLINLKRLLLPTPRLVLPPSVMTLTQLEVMNLEVADTRHISFAGFHHLKVLAIRSSITFPDGLDQLEHLEVLALNHTSMTTLPARIAGLKGLKQLALNHGQIATLPPELGALTHLEELWMINTPLTALPPKIGMLIKLKKLILSQTRLTTLPAEIGHLQALEELYLNATPLRTLPQEIGGLTALRELMLHGTQVTTLPRKVRQLPQLVHLTVGNRAIPLPRSH